MRRHLDAPFCCPVHGVDPIIRGPASSRGTFARHRAAVRDRCCAYSRRNRARRCRGDPIARVLLACDASLTASEALLIAAYPTGWRDMHLTVLRVAEFARVTESFEGRTRESPASRNVAVDHVHRRDGSVAGTVFTWRSSAAWTCC